MSQETKTLDLLEGISQNLPGSGRSAAVSFPDWDPNGAANDSWGYRIIKRIADICVSFVGLVLLSPIILVVALVVKMQDGGPIIYNQFRVGRYGKTFKFFKFRSMRVDADSAREALLHLSDVDGAAFKMRQDPRRTKFGSVMRKYSLDELPQLMSVLIGHMSIIGPRPHLPHEVETYTNDQRARLSVKPGLICLREIKGRSNLSFEEWLRLDLEYVQNRGLMTDLKIFLLSIPAVLSGEGAY